MTDTLWMKKRHKPAKHRKSPEPVPRVLPEISLRSLDLEHGAPVHRNEYMRTLSRTRDRKEMPFNSELGLGADSMGSPWRYGPRTSTGRSPF